jgi:hypothetical protein
MMVSNGHTGMRVGREGLRSMDTSYFFNIFMVEFPSGYLTAWVLITLSQDVLYQIENHLQPENTCHNGN